MYEISSFWLLRRKNPVFVLGRLLEVREELQNPLGIGGRKLGEQHGVEAREGHSFLSFGSRYACGIKPEEAEFRSSLAQARPGNESQWPRPDYSAPDGMA